MKYIEYIYDNESSFKYYLLYRLKYKFDPYFTKLLFNYPDLTLFAAMKEHSIKIDYF